MNPVFFLKLLIGSIIAVVLLYGLSLLILLSQVGRYRDHWNSVNQRSSGKKIDYVALGDSTSQGIGASSPAKGFVGLLAAELSQRQDEEVQFVNLSKSGATVKDVVDDQLPELERMKINKDTVVTIEAGANDMIRFDEKYFEKNMDILMSRLPRQTIISDIPYFGGTRFKSAEKNVIQANRIMERLAAKHGFVLVPLHDRIKGNSGLRTMAVDIFHPSDIAYRDNWFPVFKERLLK